MTIARMTDVHWLSVIVFALPGIGGALAFGLRALEVVSIPSAVVGLLDLAFMASWVSLPFTALAWLLAVTWGVRVALGRKTTLLRGLAVCVACPLAALGSWYGLAFWGVKLSFVS
jgi:hypothetical protein